MKVQNQALMVSLAVVFAIALALIVTFICLSGSPKENKQETPVIKLPSNTSPPFSDLDSTFAVTELFPSDTSPDENTEETAAALRFSKNGDGTCTLVGLGACRDAFVIIPEYAPWGDRVTAIADGALMGSTTLTAVQIPKSVAEIGYLALAGCPNLIYISVQDQNPYYCDLDGVLYSSDGQTLIQYPAHRAGTVYSLSSRVIRISDMAFYDCGYLSSIHYEGTPEQWDAILIGAKNYSLTAASVVFSADPAQLRAIP